MGIVEHVPSELSHKLRALSLLNFPDAMYGWGRGYAKCTLSVSHLYHGVTSPPARAVLGVPTEVSESFWSRLVAINETSVNISTTHIH